MGWELHRCAGAPCDPQHLLASHNVPAGCDFFFLPKQSRTHLGDLFGWWVILVCLFVCFSPKRVDGFKLHKESIALTFTDTFYQW